MPIADVETVEIPDTAGLGLELRLRGPGGVRDCEFSSLTASRIANLVSGTLQLHGWFFKIAAAELFAYNPESRQFTPLVSEG